MIPVFSKLIGRTVHHAVLKFSPRRNKLLPQASACPYAPPAACPGRNTRAMQVSDYDIIIHVNLFIARRCCLAGKRQKLLNLR